MSGPCEALTALSVPAELFRERPVARTMWVLEGTTLTADGPVPVRLGIDGERFVDPGDAPADVVFDDGFVLPAAIDIHVHYRDPGSPDKEDLTSGTTSAAFGGVALSCDMPNTDPATVTVEAYEDKARLVEEKAVTDVGLWAGLGADLAATALGDRATGYKLYAGPTTGHLLLADPASWKRAVAAVAPSGRPLAVHAEHPAVLDEARSHERRPDEPASHARSRPGRAEVEALTVISQEARRLGARLHGCHLSDPRSVDLAARAGFTTEVTPHHLFLDDADVDRLGAYAKVNPPVRDRATREALFEALASGRIDCVASDHAPHTRAEKEGGFDKAPSGLPGVETLYPMMLAEALAGRVTIERVLEACCTRPAGILGVPAGRLAPDHWASFVHVGEAPRTIRAEELHSRCGWTPFEGRAGLFPTSLAVRGRWVLEDGQLKARPGEGRFVGGPGWA